MDLFICRKSVGPVYRYIYIYIYIPTAITKPKVECIPVDTKPGPTIGSPLSGFLKLACIFHRAGRRGPQEPVGEFSGGLGKVGLYLKIYKISSYEA